MRVVVYARLDDYNATEEYIAAQLQVCRAYASQHGWQVIGSYIDRELGGVRPGFQQLIGDSSKHLFDIVLVFKLDRFAVTRQENAYYKGTLKQHGVQVLSATEYIPDTAAGVLVESLLEGLGEFNDIISHEEQGNETSALDIIPMVSDIIPGLAPIGQIYNTAQTASQIVSELTESKQQPTSAPLGVNPQHGVMPMQLQQTGAASAPVMGQAPIKKDIESFFGKHIAAVLAGVLLIAATIAGVTVVWDSVTPLMRFSMLFLLGGVLFAAALIEHPKVPEFLTYPVIKHLFASAGMAMLFITLLLGCAVLQLYPLVVAGVLLLLWAIGALYTLRRFNLVSASIVGALGVAVGCWFAVISSPQVEFTLAAVGCSCVYLVVALYEHRRRSEKILALYIYLTIISLLVLLAPLQATTTDVATCVIAGFMVGTAAGFLLVSPNMPVGGNVLYFMSSLICFVVTALQFGEMALRVYSVLLMVVMLLFAYMRITYLPAAVATMLCAPAAIDLRIMGAHCPALLAIALVMLVLGLRKNESISFSLHRWISAVCAFTALIISFILAFYGSSIVNGICVLIIAIIQVRVFSEYSQRGIFYQITHLSAAITGVVGGYMLAPNITGLHETVVVLLTSVIAAAYLLFGYDVRAEGHFFRRGLLFFCTLLSGMQASYSFGVTYTGIAFVGVIVFVFALFYRFVYRMWSVHTSVSALWIIAGQIFLWINLLVPSGLDVLPSVLMIGAGFGIVYFGFIHRRNAERISGLVLVIVCTIKAVSVDVWFAPSPVRVIALFVGAGICIAVSRLYAKQSAVLKSGGAEQA